MYFNILATICMNLFRPSSHRGTYLIIQIPWQRKVHYYYYYYYYYYYFIIIILLSLSLSLLLLLYPGLLATILICQNMPCRQEVHWKNPKNCQHESENKMFFCVLKSLHVIAIRFVHPKNHVGKDTLHTNTCESIDDTFQIEFLIFFQKHALHAVLSNKKEVFVNLLTHYCKKWLLATILICQNAPCRQEVHWKNPKNYQQESQN